MLGFLLRLLGRPARPLSATACSRIMRTYGMAGCEHPGEHLLP